MKKITLIFISIILISCNPKGQSKKENEHKLPNNFAKELIDVGFLKYAENSKIDSLKIQLTNSFDIYNEDNFKITTKAPQQIV